MSAIPLPALPVTPAPAPAPAPSPAPTSTSQSGNSAFNTHLQNVQQQQQQQQQAASEAQDASQQAAARQNSNQTSGNTNMHGKASAKPGDDASNDTAQSGDASDDSSIPTGIVSLANTVLNLIDQATGDAGKDKTAGTTGGKPANARPATQGNDQPQSGAMQALGLVAPLPPPATPAASAAGKGDDNAANSKGVAALQGNGKDSLAASMQKAANAADDSDDEGDAKAVGASGDSTAAAQTASDNSQVFAGALSAVSHATGQADATASTSSSSNTPDLASLHGVADAAAVVAPPVTPAAGTHALSVNAPVGSSGFAKELGHQVTWLSGQDIKQAQIKLNPQDLGPLDVKVSIEHGRVDVAFMTQHAATATAVQQGLDQLHQMLGGQGLSLGHTSVGQHASQQQFADQQQSSGGQMPGESDQPAGNSTGETLKRVAIGLVDAFA